MSDALFLDITRSILNLGYRVRFRAEGKSMFPSICGGDIISLERVQTATLRTGEIFLYQSPRGLTAHRLIGVSSAHELIFRADASPFVEERVKSEQILGRVVRIERENIHALLILSYSVKRWIRKNLLGGLRCLKA